MTALGLSHLPALQLYFTLVEPQAGHLRLSNHPLLSHVGKKDRTWTGRRLIKRLEHCLAPGRTSPTLLPFISDLGSWTTQGRQGMEGGQAEGHTYLPAVPAWEDL